MEEKHKMVDTVLGTNIKVNYSNYWVGYDKYNTNIERSSYIYYVEICYGKTYTFFKT